MQTDSLLPSTSLELQSGTQSHFTNLGSLGQAGTWGRAVALFPQFPASISADWKAQSGKLPQFFEKVSALVAKVVEKVLLGLASVQTSADGFINSLRFLNYSFAAFKPGLDTPWYALAAKVSNAECIAGVFQMFQSLAYLASCDLLAESEQCNLFGSVCMLGCGASGLVVLIDQFKFASLGSLAAGFGQACSAFTALGFCFFAVDGMRSTWQAVLERRSISLAIDECPFPSLASMRDGEIEQQLSQRETDNRFRLALRYESELRARENDESAPERIRPLRERSLRNLTVESRLAGWKIVSSLTRVTSSVARLALSLLLCTGFGAPSLIVVLGIVSSGLGISQIFVSTLARG